MHRWPKFPKNRTCKNNTSNEKAAGQISAPELDSCASPVLTKNPPGKDTAIDPFDSICKKIDPETHRLFTYYVHYAHPNTYHTEAKFSQRNKLTFQMDAHIVVKDSFNDEANMYTLLASMASRMKYLDNYGRQRDSAPFVAKAITAIQEQIRKDKPMTQRMVFNMFQLGTAEFFRWNVSASVVHLKAIGVLVQHLGGFEALHHSLTELIILGDGYVAAELGESPIYTAAVLDEENDRHIPPSTTRIMDDIVHGRLEVGSGFLDASMRSTLSADLRWIIMDIAVSLGVLEDCMGSADSKESSSKVLHWLHIRYLGIRHRLLALNLADPDADVIRWSLLIWNFVVFTVAGRQRTAQIVAERLRDRISLLPPHSWHTRGDVYIWIVSTGASAAKKDSSTSVWFMKALAATIKESRAPDGADWTFTAFKALHSRFCFLPSVQEAGLLVLWEAVASSRDPD